LIGYGRNDDQGRKKTKISDSAGWHRGLGAPSPRPSQRARGMWEIPICDRPHYRRGVDANRPDRLGEGRVSLTSDNSHPSGSSIVARFIPVFEPRVFGKFRRLHTHRDFLQLFHRRLATPGNRLGVSPDLPCIPAFFALIHKSLFHCEPPYILTSAM